jgi:hypothetical protein
VPRLKSPSPGHFAAFFANALRSRAGPALGGWLATLIVLGAALGVGVDYAAAARPAKGALYGGEHSGAFVYLRVSTSGRWLNPRRSAIWWEISGKCGRPFRMRFGSRRRPVRINRGGGFRFVHRRGNVLFRMRGRFVTKNRAKVRFRYRRERARGARPGACDDSSGRLVARRVGLVNFRDCSTYKAKTLLRTPTGRVFRKRTWTGFLRSRVFYACLYSTNKPIRLGEETHSFESSSFSDFRLVGPYVAYVETGPCALAYCDTLWVRDLRSGRRTKRLERGQFGVSDPKLKGNGSVAWIEPSSGRLGIPTSVWAADGIGMRRLDRGNIDATSLTLDGSTLTWRKDGVLRSATLY